ncbi:MAG: hypothetical protein ABUL77_05215 [Bacteroidota bacterium]
MVLLGLLIGEPGSASPAEVAVIEVPFSTRVGDGASGLKRIFRNGCYQVVSEGGSGAGAGSSRNSQVGCHLAGEVSAAFERLDLLASASGSGVVKEGRVSPSGGRRDESGVRAQAGVVLVRGDGSRWVAANDEVAGEFLSAINAMPSENQWHAKPPARPVGKGPQFVAVSVATTRGAGPRKLQGSLSVDGRWWCHGTGVAGVGHTATSRPLKLAPVNPRDASGRLGRILKGARAKSAIEDDDVPPDASGIETSVELVFAGRSRSGLFPKRLAKPVAQRFAVEMSRHSPLCAWP